MAETQKGMHKADFITALVLLGFGVMVVVQSVQMPRLEHRGINPYTIPGLVPGLLGIVMVILGGMLLARSITHGGYTLEISRRRIGQLITIPQVRRVTATLAVCLVYAIGFIGRLWYPVSTFLFVFGFIVLFEYRPEQPVRTKSRRIVVAGIEALLTATVVSVVFRYLFLVRLP